MRASKPAQVTHTHANPYSIGESADGTKEGPEGEGVGLEGKQVGSVGGKVSLAGRGDSPKSECCIRKHAFLLIDPN